MAGTSIGAASLKVVASTDKLSTGLEKAHNLVKGFKNKVGSTFKNFAPGGAVSNAFGGGFAGTVGKMFNGMGGKLSSLGSAAGGAIGMALGGPIGSAVGGALGAIPGQVVGMTGDLFGGITSSIKELGAIGKQAKGLGIASDQFMGLSLAAKKAGVDAETFGFVMAKSQAKVVSETPAVQSALAKIGLSAAALKGMSPDQNFYAIAKGMESVHDQGDKAFIATQLFGKAGLTLLPMLAEGEAGLRKYVDQQKKLGNAIDQKGMDKIIAARSALPKIEQAFSGLWNKIVVAAAPMVTKIANLFSKILDKAMPIFDWLSRAAESYFGIWGDVVGEVVDGIFEIIHTIGDWIGSMTGAGDEFMSVGDLIELVLKNVGRAGAFVWDTLKVGAGVFAYAIGEVIQVFVDLRKMMVDTYKSIPGHLRPKWADDLVAEGDKVAAWAERNAKKMSDWGKGTFGNFGKSVSQVDAWFDKRKKKGKDDEETKAFTDAVVPTIAAAFKYQATAAMERGSKEEYSARLKWQSGSQNTQDKQLTELRAGNVIGKQLVGEVQKLNAKPAVNLPLV